MPSLRVMTANLLVDNAAPASLGAAIDEYRPDVLAVQELGPSTAAVIEDRMVHRRLDPRDDGFGLGIAARLPVGVERLELEERSGWIATLDPVDWGFDRRFVVVNVHLTNPIDFPWHRTRRTREAQVTGITEAIGRIDDPYVIVGDMNSTPAWPAYRRLTALGDDVARVTRTQARTWNHTLRGPRLLRIDHGFVRGATPTMTRTVTIEGTDHRSLVIDLEV